MMKLQDFIDVIGFEVLNLGANGEREVTKVFCCDLLSIAMSKAPVGSVWVTIMGNINAIAVSVLTDISCIILAEGITLDEPALQKAIQQNVTVLRSEKPIFEIALFANELIHA